jgi:integrase
MLSDAVHRHLELYRSMGFQYRVQEYLLLSFVAFAESRSESFLQTATVLEWAASAPSLRQRYNRLLVVRRLACALHAEEERHQVPPADVFGRAPQRRRTCHIFTEEELACLLQAATHLSAKRSMQAVTFTAFVSLLAATGLRVSEALHLQLADVTEDGLVIRATKFQKSRLVPLHETVRQGLQQYLMARNRSKPVSSAVFVSKRGAALPYSTVNQTFLSLARSAGLRGGPGQRGCRLHDLRHTFAVRSLEQCTGDRQTVARHMAALSTYLGHAHVSDTYWYLQATSKLLGDVAEAAETLHRGGQR